MLALQTALLLAAAACVAAQAQHTTPVPILKQINKQNDDGSYSFGYEAADGSFKIETKYPNGDVAGKYGYVDDGGKLREISYGAGSKRGFEPQGAGIVVAPPSLNEPTNELGPGEEDDGQYREDPRIYDDPKYSRPAAPSAAAGRSQLPLPPAFRQYHKQVEPQRQRAQYSEPQEAPAPVTPAYRAPQFQQQSNLLENFPHFGQSRPQSQIYHQQPQFSYQAYTPQPYEQQQKQYQPQYQQPQYQPQQYQQPQYQPQQYQQPQYQPQQYQQPQYESQQYQQPQYQQNYNPFLGHPAQNFDPNTGSYSVTFTG